MACIDEKKLREYALWIERCENDFACRVREIAEDICKNKGSRIIRLYGPSCSGKTTASRLLTDMFESLGITAHTVSIDDFFYDRDVLWEKSKEKGLSVVDYDSPDTIDVKALHDFAEEIFESEEVHCPIYDFKLGARNGYRTMRVGKNDVFIFEGIQACYPSVKEMLSEHGSVSIFIATQSSVFEGGVEFAPNRIRLMRRLVRDYHFRGSPTYFTMKLWQGVRDNERKNIFPYAEQSDYKIDSTMAYEIGVLKPYLEELLADTDELGEFLAQREEILCSIREVESIPSSLILDGYLYREFV